MKNYIYDLETYQNFFCGVFNNQGEEEVFEISARKNDYEALCDFYNPAFIKFAIGFNNARFDAQVMQYLINNRAKFSKLQGSELTKLIYDFVQSIIKKADLKEFLPYAEWSVTVPQIDLFLINHYNNKNKMTSLKWIEFSINHDKVQDLPYKFDRPLHSSTFDEVIEYCKNDVNATRKFAEACMDLIKLRISQDKQYPELRLRNKPDSSVGESLFLHFMSEAMGVPMKELKTMRTHRAELDVKDIILPYINFKTPQFQGILDWYKASKTGGLQKSVMFGGIEFVFGEGGIHASWENKIFEADDEYDIWDIDVESYYPNLAIVNNFRPEHLGEAFSRVYNNIFLERKKYPKGTVENYSYKIILNGSYGKFGDVYSFLYDKKVMHQICINGQLLIAMLCERLSFIEGVTIIQANTDGVTIKIKKSKKAEAQSVCKRWEKLTSLKLEYADYKKMVINNVNNYMAQTTSGEIKDKGAAYIVNPDLHKNKSQRIVQIALRKYFFENIPIRETIENHLKTKEKGMEWDEKKGKFKVPFNGIYDFCLGKKVQWNQNFVILKGMNEINIGQKVIRYYITSEKATMMKKYNDGRIESVNKGYNAKLFQNYKKQKDYGINYEYYINECYKITTPFEGGNPKIGKQLSLFDE
jgi:hypothetical protein